MKPSKNTVNIVFSALFTALIAVCAQIALPLPFDVAFTLQTLGVALCGYTLGVKWGTASVITYILAGAVGLPVFSHFRGGIQVIFSPSGGFILGFIPLLIFCSFGFKKDYLRLVFGFFGILICHLIGVIQFSLFSNTGFVASFSAVSLPFVLKDIISVWAALYISKYIIKIKNSR